MYCPICTAKTVQDLNKSVRGCDAAEVVFCSACEHAHLIDCSITEAYYQKEYDTFLAERSKDMSWTEPESHARRRVVQGHERIAWVGDYVALGSADSLLELGCSSGFFLQALKEKYHGMAVQGVEPSIRHRERAQSAGLQVAATHRELKPRQFDIVLSFFVLEHILDPGPWLEDIAEMVKPGGQLVMVVPNGREAMVSTYPRSNYDRFVWQAPHISYFSQQSLLLLLSRLDRGARVFQHQRYSLNNHLNWLSGTKPEKEERYDHVTDEVDRAYKKSLVDHGIADTLLGVVNL